MKLLSRVRRFVTPWTVAHQAPSSMGFSRQEYWSGLPFPSPGDLPNPGIEPRSPALQADALTSEPYVYINPLPPEPPSHSPYFIDKRIEVQKVFCDLPKSHGCSVRKQCCKSYVLTLSPGLFPFHDSICLGSLSWAILLIWSVMLASPLWFKI